MGRRFAAIGPRLRRTAALAAAVALAGCSSRFGAPEPASREGDTFLDMWRGMFWAAMAVGGIVWALILWSVIRYRRRSDDTPSQKGHNLRMEIVYTSLPIVIVAIIFAVAVRTEHSISRLSADPDLTVRVEGFQWQWRFSYLDEDVVVTGTPGDLPELVLPVGETARLELVALDVDHAFWVPNFLEKRDLIPRVDNEIDVTPTEVGTYRGRCAEFCGLDHWRMNFTVRVVSRADIDAGVAER